MDIVVLSGTVGAGKTTVPVALRRELMVRGRRAVDLDVETLTHDAPAPADDPFNERVVVAHLGSMRERWREGGVEVLVLARVVESAEQRDAYAQALGSPV